MLKAQQAALGQATNQGLLAIRQQEINYYGQFSYTFGVQAALIGGFAYQALTQVAFPYAPFTVSPLNSVNVTYDDYQGLPLAIFPGYAVCEMIYWYSSAICMAASIHCILCTIFVQVLGPALAIYGPLGSMAKAANGMRTEMTQILYSFMISVIFFAISTLFSFWILMSVQAAIASSIVFALSCVQWWKYSVRIYAKLYLDYDSPELKEQRRLEEDGLFDDDDDDPTEPCAQHPTPQTQQTRDNFKAKRIKKKKLFGFTRKTSSVDSDQDADNDEEKKDDESDRQITIGSRKSRAIEGYMTKCDGKGRQNWTRRYFVLTKDGDLYYYKAKANFIADPKSPIKIRPIELGLYDVEATLTEAAAGGASAESLYEISLSPKDKEEGGRVWLFRCDNDDEFVAWKECLSIATSMEI